MAAILQTMADSWSLWCAAALALATAIVYLVIASPVVAEDYKAPPAPVLFVAGVAYLVGGGLILFADRRLLTLGAVLNALVFAAYLVAALKGHAEVDRLALSSKAAQIALEALLIWLVVQPTAPIDALG